MKVVKEEFTNLWVVQPKIKSGSRILNDLLIKDEAVSLSKALPGTKLCGATIVPIEKIRPKEFFGKGKVDELASIIKFNKIQLVIINSQISPVQQQSLENKWRVKILDRTALILEIFSDRAVTKEGVLQVEMAKANAKQRSSHKRKLYRSTTRYSISHR